jgi:hypothetical protein
MPVVLVNPSGGTMSNPKRRRRRRRRRRKNPTRRRRATYTNPRTSATGALAATGLGFLGGGVAYGIDWGVDYAPVSPAIRSVILGVGGAATSFGVAMLADDRAAAGIAGGTGALLIGRVRQQLALAGAGKEDKKKKEEGGKAALEAGQVYWRPRYGARPDAGVVVPQGQAPGVIAGAFPPEAGAILGQEVDWAATMRGSPFARGKTYKHAEAGASRYIPGPIRWYGPQSWAYRYDSGVVYRSAHSSG